MNHEIIVWNWSKNTDILLSSRQNTRRVQKIRHREIFNFIIDKKKKEWFRHHIGISINTAPSISDEA